MKNLNKNLQRLLIGFNAFFIASFFFNWINIKSLPGFITATAKKIDITILGNYSPLKIVTKMSEIKDFYVANNVKLVGGGKIAEAIPIETSAGFWLIVFLALAVITMVALIAIPNKKYTVLLPLVSSLYNFFLMIYVLAFIKNNNAISPKITVANPGAVLILVVIAVIVSLFISVYLASGAELHIMDEAKLRIVLIITNVIFIGSFFTNWLHIQLLPRFIQMTAGAIESDMTIVGDYSPFKLVLSLGKLKNYYETLEGVITPYQVTSRIWMILFLGISVLALVMLIFAKTKRSIAIALVSSMNAALFSVGFILFCNKYNIIRPDIEIATYSPVVVFILIISMLSLLGAGVALAERNRQNYGYLFVAPFFLVFITFSIYPIFQTAYFTFTNKTTAIAPFEVVGFDNWARFLKDPQFIDAFINTWKIWGLNIILQLGLAMFLVFLFSDITWKLKALGFFRTIFYLPNLITLASVAMLFRILLDWKYGAINQSLVSLNLVTSEPNWLATPQLTQMWVAIIGAWLWFGNSFLFLMAGVQGISSEYFEAAKVDGANRLQMFNKITLPLLRPIMLYVAVTSLIGGMQIFELPQLMTDGLGAPDNSLLTMVLLLYNQYYKYKNMAYASTIAYGIFFITIIFTLIAYRMMFSNKDKGGVN